MFPDYNSLEADTDWVTALTENELDGAALRAISERYFALAEIIKPWRMRGYHGRQGRDLQGYGGGIAYGENLAGVQVSFILQSWGEVCRQVARSILAYHHMRVSRMDYAVTVLFARELPPVAEWPLEEWRAQKWRVTRIVPSDGGGGTLYVGSRGSDVFGRVYDKGKQLGTIPDRTYWRWEVEWKGHHAKQAFANYMTYEDRVEAARFVAGQVGGYYQEHGVPFPPVRDCTLDRPVIRYATRVKSSETTIKWLHQQVSPALRTLDCAGLLADALDALGVYGDNLWMPPNEVKDLGGWEQSTFLQELSDV